MVAPDRDTAVEGGAAFAATGVERHDHAMRLLILALGLMAVASGGVAGCAHETAPQAQRDARRLRSLEPGFQEFVAVRLRAEDDIEPAIARLESLRLEYLDALGASTTEQERLLGLLRIAEAHLDVSARIRRIPYPGGLVLDDDARQTFDRRLSARALPLEATGLSLLEQLVVHAESAGLDGRFVHRARLYLRLHRLSTSDAALDDSDVRVLRMELTASSFRAPRTLLDAGRIGQRAARR